MSFAKMGARGGFGSAGNLGGVSPPPAWVLAGANIGQDYAGGRYYGGSLASLISFTRASQKTDLLPSSASGAAYNTFLNAVMAITPGLGFLPEDPRTNLFLNSTAPVTQTISLASTGSYALWVNGSGSAAIAQNSATITGAGTASNGSPVIINCTVSGTVDVTITGALQAVQLEKGAFGTSFIPTGGSAVLRAEDVASASSTLLSILQGAQASVIVQAGPLPNVGSFPRIIGSRPSLQAIPLVGSAGTGIGIYNGSSSRLATGGNILTGSRKIGVSWDGSGRSVVGNNGTLTTDANTQLSEASYFIGGAGTGGGQCNGYIANVFVWNTRLADATLKAFTA